MSLAQKFEAAFGAAPALLARAPGRVNLIGEHTDYNNGFVLPCAISVESRIAASPRSDGLIRVVACDFGGALAEWPVNAPFAANPAEPWADYIRAMTTAMAERGYALTGADIAVSGTVPKGAGLSSSASLMVGIGTALAALSGLVITPTDMARMAQAGECDHVGVRCGIMDQLASAAGRGGHALMIDCRSLDVQPVALPAGAQILIVHSGVERGLVEGAYNKRRAQCEAAAAAMGVAALRDADLTMLERAQLDPLTTARARHVSTENARGLAATEALAAGLVSETVPADQVETRARALALEIAANCSPVALALTRRMLWHFSGDTGPGGALSVDAALNIALGAKGDVHEGVAAFLEKRAPDFPLTVSADLPATPWWPDEPENRRQGNPA